MANICETRTDSVNIMQKTEISKMEHWGGL